MAALLKKRALAEYSQVQDQIFSKKICLNQKKSLSSSSFSAYLGLLEKSKTSNEALHALLRISDSLDLDNVDFTDIIKKLSEHYRQEKEASVRVKILSLFAEIGLESSTDLITFIDETIQLLKDEKSHKVLAQGILTCLKLGKTQFFNEKLAKKLTKLAEEKLKDTNHSVKCRCLELISVLLSKNIVDPEKESKLQLINSYAHSQDARVRSEAYASLIKLHKRGFKLNVSFYEDICKALNDDYEIVRKEALNLVWIFGNTYSEKLLTISDTEQNIRLIDDAFGKVCSCVSDLSVRVRAQACHLLGLMQGVSSKFLHQTLHKKLMSNMRRKKTLHEREWENVTSGEWASGKKWNDDAPKEILDKESINLISSGACGALVHGLEDEYLEVRTEAVESLCQLSLTNVQFASTAIDFLVDMFNDEIESVRLKAIDSMTRISNLIVLRDDQLETILGALEDFSIDVRESLHRMLASCQLATSTCLQICVQKLLDNLRKYPCDRRSTWRLLQKCGQKHPELTIQLVPQLLNIHPFFDTPEPDVEDPAYISILILILNAAQNSPTMISLFQDHTIRHYTYLRDTMPNLVPYLNIKCKNIHKEQKLSMNIFSQNDVFEKKHANKNKITATNKFLQTIVDNIKNAPYSVRKELLESARQHLNKIAEMEQDLNGSAHFIATHIGAQLLLEKIIKMNTDGNRLFNSTQTNRSLSNDLLLQCSKLKYLFTNLNHEENISIAQLHLLALGHQLCTVVRTSNISALTLCQHFLNNVDQLKLNINEYYKINESKTTPPQIILECFKALANLEDSRPGSVTRVLYPILSNFRSGCIQLPVPRNKIRMCHAVILQPSGENDSALKFTAGLMVSVPFEAEIYNLLSKNYLRIKVKYPDQQIQLLMPKPIDIRPLNLGSDDPHDSNNYRLLTQVLLSHQVWSEACNVAVNLALSVPESDCSPPAIRRALIANVMPDPSVIDLCDPVNIYVAPKAVRKGI